MVRGAKRFQLLVLGLIIACCVLAACDRRPAREAQSPAAVPSSPNGGTPTALVFVDEGVNVETSEVRGSFHAGEGSSISPDGKYILGILNDAAADSVVAYPLRPGLKPVELYKRSTAQPGNPSLIPLGWTSGNDCVFLVDKVQPPASGEGAEETPGAVVCTGSLSSGSSTAGCFIPGASYCGAWLLPEQSKVYLHLRMVENEGTDYVRVYRAFWEVNLDSGEAYLLKDRLPTYDGLFRAALTSGGEYFVYELHEQDRSGAFVLDTATCEERALMPDGLTKSFLPAVSPDGHFVAAYAAGQVKDESGQVTGYDVYPDVDGVRPAAHMLRVVNLAGREVAAVDMKDKVITDIEWSADSRSLSFQVGTMTKVQAYEYDFAAENIWMVNWPVPGTDLPLAPAKVATMSEEDKSARWIEQHPTTDGVGVVWAADGGDLRLSVPGASTIVIRQHTQAQLHDGWWQPSPEMLGGFAVDWSGEPGRRLKELWLLGSAYSRRFACYGGSSQFQGEIVGVYKDAVAVLRRPDPAREESYLDVFTFAPGYLDQKAWAARAPWERVKMAVGRVLNVEGYVAGSGDTSGSADCRSVDGSFYLVALRGAQDRYVWADMYGNTARIAIGAAHRPELEGIRSNSEGWFVCSVKADNWTAFPYYLVANPRTADLREEPWFKEPRGDRFTVSLPGASYRVDDLTVADRRIDMAMSITGPAPGEPGLAGGRRPPRILISEQSPLVTFTMLDVDIPDDLRARIGSFTSPYAALKGISQSDGNVEMVFSVTGTYSFSTPDQVPEEPDGQHVRCTILFDRPLARDPRSPD